MSHHVDNRGPQVAGTAGAFLAASWIFMFLRIYTRTRLAKNFGLDDYLALISQLFYTCFCAFALLGARYGTGKHTVDIPPLHLIQGLKWWWLCELMYALGNMILKFSIGIFLLRITIIRWHRLVLYATIVGSGVLGIWFLFIFLFQCYPSQYFWTQYIGGKGSCLNADVIVYSTYVFCTLECIADWIYFVLPCLIVWKLQMNIKTKAWIIVLLGLCAVASIVTIIRFPYISGFSNKTDFLWATTDVAILALVENGIGSCTASMAILRPLFMKFFSALIDSSPSYPLSDVSGYPRTQGYKFNSQSPNRGSQNSMAWKDVEGSGELALVPGDLTRNTGVTTTIKRGSIYDGDEIWDTELGEQATEHRRHVRKASYKGKVSEDGQDKRGVWTTTTVISKNDSVTML